MDIAGHRIRRKSPLRRSLAGACGTLVAVLALLIAVPDGATATTPDPSAGTPAPTPTAPAPTPAPTATVPAPDAAPTPAVPTPAVPAGPTPDPTPDPDSTPGPDPTPGPDGHITHPELDWMGSTVAAHEGRSTSSGGTVTPSVTQTPGFDVSHWQGTVNWTAAWNSGARFAYIKATEGTTYRDPNFSANYTNSFNAGYIRGSYHFATPDTSSAVAQADYFVAHGGGWSKDGKTLPPMLDIEYNPYGATCFGLSQSAMRGWISAFLNEVHAKTTRWATIYTTTDWWTTCTGNTTAYATTAPLFIARYASTPGTLPAGWPFHTFWQHADSGVFPGDQDYFNGAYSGLQNLANNA